MRKTPVQSLSVLYRSLTESKIFSQEVLLPRPCGRASLVTEPCLCFLKVLRFGSYSGQSQNIDLSNLSLNFEVLENEGWAVGRQRIIPGTMYVYCFL
jgi:hypothetical protein